MPDPKNSRLTERGRHDELLKVAEQAAAWLIELEDGGPRERAAFATWLEESPLHVEMFLRANSVDRMMELVEPADVKALAQKNWGDVNTVTEFPRSFDPPPPAPVPARWVYKQRFAGIAAAALALTVGTVWYEVFGPGAWDVQQTQVGEQRVVQLEDGSIIYVNTDSRLEVHYTKAARNVRLRDGEALFKVAHDAQRPFRVLAGDSSIQAIGTQFNVYRRSNETKVAVVEGIVQVSKGAGESPGGGTPIAKDLERLTAGQGLVLDEGAVPKKPVAVNIEQATAWRQRRLVFEWQTLEEITAEFNRYNRSPQIRVEGEEVRKRRFTAVFDADNPQTLLKFLSKDDHIQFAAEGDDFVIRSR